MNPERAAKETEDTWLSCLNSHRPNGGGTVKGEKTECTRRRNFAPSKSAKQAGGEKSALGSENDGRGKR